MSDEGGALTGERLLEALADLAREAGLEVKPVGTRLPDSDFAPSSGVCRVRDSTWILLVPGDPVEARVAVVASALRDHAAEVLATRWLPPALRAALDAGGDADFDEPSGSDQGSA